jgi:hypothetical protein
MTELQQFLAWFDGYSENIKQRPTAAQWAKVVEKIKSIKVAPAVPALAVANSFPAAGSKGHDPNKPRPVMSSGVAMSAGP